MTVQQQANAQIWVCMTEDLFIAVLWFTFQGSGDIEDDLDVQDISRMEDRVLKGQCPRNKCFLIYVYKNHEEKIQNFIEHIQSNIFSTIWQEKGVWQKFHLC